MGYDFFDHYVMKKALQSITPNNTNANAQKYSNYITKINGGDRALSEVCLHLLKKFFVPYDLDKMSNLSIKPSGELTI